MEGQRRCWQRRRSALEKWRGAILAPTTVTDQNAHLLNSPPASPETFLPTHPPTDPPTHLVLPGSPCCPPTYPPTWYCRGPPAAPIARAAGCRCGATRASLSPRRGVRPAPPPRPSLSLSPPCTRTALPWGEGGGGRGRMRISGRGAQGQWGCPAKAWVGRRKVPEPATPPPSKLATQQHPTACLMAADPCSIQTLPHPPTTHPPTPGRPASAAV